MSSPADRPCTDEPVPELTDAAALHVVDLTLSRRPGLATGRLVALDGPAGSGKTSLAERVRAEVAHRGRSVVVLHLDDLYAGWTGLDDALADRVLAQVLTPLARGEQARWQRYDWHGGAFAEWHTFSPPDVLVVEGCGAGDRAYAQYTGVLAWVEADRAERIRRGVARDGAQVLPQWLAWMDREGAHFAVNETRARADLRFRTG